jgi:asparagine synthase (glutamine-hydrolysing)
MMTAQALTADVEAKLGWVAVYGHRQPGASPSARTLGALPGGTCVTVEGQSSETYSAASDRWRGLLFDGVLHNRSELSASLGIATVAAREAALKGCAAGSTSDASLLLAAYDRWGVELTRRIKGIYSIVIWDGMQRRLFAIRDPLGAYPLFFARGSGDRLLVSTSIDALVNHPSVDPSVNRAALADHLCHRWPYPEETFYSAVRRVPPGCRLIVGDEGTRIERHWDPAPDGEPVDWITESQLEEFDDRLDTAVARAMALGRSGIFLSGGLDSISVAAVAADLARRSQKPDPIALSLGFPHPDCNEELVQRGVATSLGLEHEFIPFMSAVQSQGLLAPALEMTRASSAPLLNTWSPAYTELALRGKRRGAQVILTGSGGDEWLTVSPYLSADLIRAGDFSGFATLFTTWQRSYRLPLWRLLRSTCWTFGMRPLAGVALHRMAPRRWQSNRAERLRRATSRPWVAPDAQLRADLDRRIEALLTPSDPARGFYFHEVRTSLDHTLTSMELEEVFDMGRRLGMRIMHPYWDADLVDMLYRTPPHLLMRSGRAKGLVRETVARRFPSLGLDRQKKVAATSFYRSVLQHEVPRLWKSSGGAPALAALGVIDPGRTDDMVRKALSQFSRAGLSRVWDVMNLEAWVRSRTSAASV